MKLTKTTYTVSALMVAAIGAGVLTIAAVAGSGEPVAAPRSIALGTTTDDKIADANEKANDIKKRQEEYEKLLTMANQELVNINQQLEELEPQLTAAKQALKEAEDALAEAEVQQGIINERLTAARLQDEGITARIANGETRIAEIVGQVATLARESYQSVGQSDALKLVFGATTTDDFILENSARNSESRFQTNALDELENIQATNRNRQERQSAVREYIEELKVQVDELVAEAEKIRGDVAAKKSKLDGLVKEQQSLKAKVESNRQKFLAEQEQLEKDQKALTDELARLIEQKRKEQNPGNPTPIGKGYLSFPTANPYITSNYGNRLHPVLGIWRLHAGTDFRAYCGTAIYAAADGVVTWAKYYGGFGNQVLVDHGWVNGNGLSTSYSHLSRFAVSSGQSVKRGDLVGYSGNTGTSTACHLHFETYVDGKTVNPMSILGSIP